MKNSPDCSVGPGWVQVSEGGSQELLYSLMAGGMKVKKEEERKISAVFM